MHINYKNHLSIYKDLRKNKVDKNNVISDHSHKVNSPISCLQDNSSEVIENIIHRKYGSRSLSNITDTSDSSLFRTTSTISSNTKPTTNQQGCLLFFGDNNYHRTCPLTRLSLQLQFLILLYIWVYHLIFLKNQDSRRY